MRRKSFWTSWWSVGSTSKRFSFMRFWLLSLFSTVLVTLAGPSSAIAVIPTLNYFDIGQPFNQTMLPYYVFNASTELWPTVLTAASINAPNSGINCSDPLLDEPDQENCPAGGFNSIYTWAQDLFYSNGDKGKNITIENGLGATHRIVATQSCNSNFSGRASAVSLNEFLSGAMTLYWTFSQNNLGKYSPDRKFFFP